MQNIDGKRSRASSGVFAALWAALIVAAAGGGASAAPVETVLHSFTGSDGDSPLAGLIADRSGNLYGTTFGGGASASDEGVVFKLSPSGTETVLYSFTGGSDGSGPAAGLIADSKGNLYGTTVLGGTPGDGVVFKLTGTGFVTGIPFAAFGTKLAIDFGKTANTDSFEIQSSFTLGSTSKGINPPAEPVTLQIGTFTTTIPAGSFKGTGFGPFTFNGMIGGVGLGVRIEPIGAKRYAMKAEAPKAKTISGTLIAAAGSRSSAGARAIGASCSNSRSGCHRGRCKRNPARRSGRSTGTIES